MRLLAILTRTNKEMQQKASCCTGLLLFSSVKFSLSIETPQSETHTHTESELGISSKMCGEEREATSAERRERQRNLRVRSFRVSSPLLEKMPSVILTQVFECSRNQWAQIECSRNHVLESK